MDREVADTIATATVARWEVGEEEPTEEAVAQGLIRRARPVSLRRVGEVTEEDLEEVGWTDLAAGAEEAPTILEACQSLPEDEGVLLLPSLAEEQATTSPSALLRVAMSVPRAELEEGGDPSLAFPVEEAGSPVVQEAEQTSVEGERRASLLSRRPRVLAIRARRTSRRRRGSGERRRVREELERALVVERQRGR